MKYVIFRTSGKQYKATEGDIVNIPGLEAKVGQEVPFDEILLYASDGDCRIGKPKVADILLSGKVLSEEKGEKIRILKFKSKVRHRRASGQRQLFKKIQITNISSSKEEKESSEKKETKKSK